VLTEVKLSLYFLYLCLLGIYNVYFHPLRKFPGPKVAAVTRLHSVFYILRGQRSSYAKKLHERYGEVVRTKPNELSFIGQSAWKDIYMHRQGQKQMQKSERTSSPIGGYSIINCPDDVHTRQRRLLSHAFSERAASEDLAEFPR
jgi:cytochrome P450